MKAAPDRRLTTALLILGLGLVLFAGGVALNAHLQAPRAAQARMTGAPPPTTAGTDTQASDGSSTSMTTTEPTTSSPTPSSTSTASFASASSSTSTLQGASEITLPIDVGDNMSLNFEPAHITVVIGVNNTIVWNDLDYEQHNIESSTIASGAEPWNSGTMNQGQTFTVTLTVPGDYKYFCEIHPWMVGTIEVVQ